MYLCIPEKAEFLNAYDTDVPSAVIKALGSVEPIPHTDYKQEAELIVVCTVEYNDQRPLSTTHILILSLTVNTPRAFLFAGDAGGMKAASLMMSLFILPRFVMQ